MKKIINIKLNVKNNNQEYKIINTNLEYCSITCFLKFLSIKKLTCSKFVYVVFLLKVVIRYNGFN